MPRPRIMVLFNIAQGLNLGVLDSMKFLYTSFRCSALGIGLLCNLTIPHRRPPYAAQ